MNCKNCNANLSEDNNYCNVCGAKTIRNRLTLKNLFADFSEQFLNYDNKFLKTFICLFTKPEDVIGSYINGTRKKYVNVISYFAIALTISGLQLFILKKFFPELMDLSVLAVDENAIEIQKQNMFFIQEYQSIIMMFYVPIYAVISKLVFFKDKKFNYTEHLIIFMYILAHISIVSALIVVFLAFFGVSLGEVALFVLPIQIVYSAYCLKHLYKLNLSRILLKTFLFFLILFILVVLLSIISVGIAFINPELLKDFVPEK